MELAVSTQDVLDRVHGHLSQAAQWAEQATSEQEHARRHQTVDRMAHSFWRSWTSLFMQRCPPNDTLHIAPDPFGPNTLSLGWHDDSGYNRGLLYHPTHRDDQPHGIWSIHT